MTPKRSPAAPSEPSPTPLFDFAADSPAPPSTDAPTQAPKRARRAKATQAPESTKAPTKPTKRTRTTKKAAVAAQPSELPPNERPFEIPKNWLWTRLGDVAQIYNGNSINAKEKAEKYSTKCDGLSFIATKDVGFDSVIDYENGIYIPGEQTKNFKIAPRNSALLCMEGGSAGRKVGLLEQDVCFGNKLCCFAPLFFDGRYLFNYLQSPDFFAEFKRQLAGLIGGVGTQKLKAIPIPVPPLAEIPRIVALIERLFARLDEAAEIVRATLERLDLAKKALLAQAFRGELGTNDANAPKAAELPELPPNERPFEIPENWLWTRLGDVARWGSGGTPSRKIPQYYDGSIPWIKSGELNDDYVFDSEEKITEEAIKKSSAKLYPPNTVVIAMYGATIGKTAILGVQAATNQACACAVCRDFLDYRFLFNYARSQKDAFIKKGKGGAQPNILQEVIKPYPFPLPPLAEQERVVALIERQTEKYDEARELAEATAARIETLKKAILARAFRGELGTNDPTDEKPFATAPTA